MHRLEDDAAPHRFWRVDFSIALPQSKDRSLSTSLPPSILPSVFLPHSALHRFPHSLRRMQLRAARQEIQSVQVPACVGMTIGDGMRGRERGRRIVRLRRGERVRHRGCDLHARTHTCRWHDAMNQRQHQNTERQAVRLCWASCTMNQVVCSHRVERRDQRR